MGRDKWVMVIAAAVVLAVMACLITGCGGGEQRPATPVTVPQEREARAFGPPVSAIQPDLEGDLEQKEAMVLLARLAAQNPTAKTVSVIACILSNIENKRDETWEYDREHGRFVWRLLERETGDVTEYRYSEVTDEILTDIAGRALDEFVDQSDLSGYGCPEELVRNGRILVRNGRPVRGGS